MVERDPWGVLGLGPGASIEDARAARRRLAKQLHPDLHAARSAAERDDLARRMIQVNLALAEVEAGPAHSTPADRPHPPATVVDAGSFSLEALPVEAFEALFLIAYGLGDILVADEPYRLELYLPEPDPCFCQLELVPEAGASLVTVDVAPAEDAELPPVSAVRDLLVNELNALAGAGPA